MDEIIEKALEYRVIHKLTQVEMAQLVGVSRETYHAVENGKRPISKVVRKKLEIMLQRKKRDGGV